MLKYRLALAQWGTAWALRTGYADHNGALRTGYADNNGALRTGYADHNVMHALVCCMS